MTFICFIFFLCFYFYVSISIILILLHNVVYAVFFLFHTFVSWCGVVLQPFTRSPFLWPLIVKTITQFLIIVITLHNFHLSNYFCFYPRIKVNGLNLEALCDLFDFIKYDNDKWVENLKWQSHLFRIANQLQCVVETKHPLLKNYPY
jgi:hypothetical protein